MSPSRAPAGASIWLSGLTGFDAAHVIVAGVLKLTGPRPNGCGKTRPSMSQALSRRCCGASYATGTI